MRHWLVTGKEPATSEELRVFDHLVNWASTKDGCRFQSSKSPSFVVSIPTRVPTQILTVQAKDIVFYSRHLIGQPHHFRENDTELTQAVRLVQEFWVQLHAEFQWQRLFAGLEEYQRFLWQCDELGPLKALLSAKESKTPAREPRIALRALADKNLLVHPGLVWVGSRFRPPQ